MATRICRVCKRGNCERTPMFNEALRADDAAMKAVRNPETRAAVYAESKRAWARSEVASNACRAISDKFIEDCKKRCAFIDARAETRAKRALFAQAIALGMAQVYNNKQCRATMLCMRGAR